MCIQYKTRTSAVTNYLHYRTAVLYIHTRSALNFSILVEWRTSQKKLNSTSQVYSHSRLHKAMMRFPPYLCLEFSHPLSMWGTEPHDKGDCIYILCSGALLQIRTGHLSYTTYLFVVGAELDFLDLQPNLQQPLRATPPLRRKLNFTIKLSIFYILVYLDILV